MTYELQPRGQRAYCDRCLLATPRMQAASAEAAAQILRAAGWRTIEPGGHTLCPRCGAFLPEHRRQAR